jgi:hypothetical protein
VVPQSRDRDPDARIDFAGALLCALGLAGMTFGLIEQPLHGWGSPLVFLPLALGALLFAGFLLYEARTEHPMLPLGLFKRRNFAAGNIETFVMYGGLGVVFFLLVLYLQQVAGFSALAAGATNLPLVLLMFALSARFGALADRYGPRFFMGAGPLIAAAGIALLAMVGSDVNFVTDLLPGLVLFGLGLSMTVAPLTATVLADADESNAGIASGVNNAIARVAALVVIASVGAVVSAYFGVRIDDELGSLRSRPEVASALEGAKRQPLAKLKVRGLPAAEGRRVERAAEDASTSAFRMGIGLAAVLVALGGVLGIVGIRNPRRKVSSEDCPGGQLAGTPREGARQSPCDWQRESDRLPRASVPRPAGHRAGV